MNELGRAIRKYRELRGYSQEYVAIKLGITQSNYAKIESEDIKITFNRLKMLAEILEIDLAELVNTNRQVVHNLHNSQHGNVYHFIENLYFDNKDVYNQLLAEKDKRILQLENEIIFLRTIIKS